MSGISQPMLPTLIMEVVKCFFPLLHLGRQVWTCGGELLISTCSHVGHVFRKKTPYTFPGGTQKVVNHNNARLASVWLDEWKDLYFSVNPGLSFGWQLGIHTYTIILAACN